MKFLLAMVIFMAVSCSNHQIRIYETSFIDGCIMGMMVMAQSMKMNGDAIRVRSFCQSYHYEMIKQQNPEYKMQKMKENYSGTRI